MSNLSAWMEGLTPEMIAKAKEDLGETPEVKTQSINDLKRLIYETANFNPRMDDAFLLRFLRARKYNITKAFKTIRNYYIFKSRFSGLYTDFTPLDVKRVLDTNNMFILPKRHPSGELLVAVRAGRFYFANVKLEEIFAAVLVCEEVALEIEATQVNGAIFIVDLAQVDLRQIKFYASPTIIYRLFHAIQDCLPFRLKGVHFLNENFAFNIIFSIAKKVMSEKLMGRVFFHGKNYESLHQHIPPDILPSEFGGKAEPINTEEFLNKVYSREADFQEIKKYGFQKKSPS